MVKIRLFEKRERWGCTIWAWILIVVLIVLFIFGFTRQIVPYLSDEETVDAKVLIVEGYIPDYAFEDVIQIFNDGEYDVLIAAGASYDQGFYISGVQTAAHLISRSLTKLGFDTTKMAVVPNPPGVFRDRTYFTAMMTRKYIDEHLPGTKSVNIISLGTHSRRSRYLYRQVYEPDIQLGNIVIHDRVIASRKWYESSRGFRTVMNETLGYLYCYFAFNPEDSLEMKRELIGE